MKAPSKDQLNYQDFRLIVISGVDWQKERENLRVTHHISGNDQASQSGTTDGRPWESNMAHFEYQLHAFDLDSKFGFADGNMFGALLREKLGRLAPNKREVLVECVKRFLLPAIPRRVQTMIVAKGHNPIRLVAGETIDDVEDVTVGIREKDVLQIARELLRRVKS
jgi:hypothetical protein